MEKDRGRLYSEFEDEEEEMAVRYSEDCMDGGSRIGRRVKEVGSRFKHWGVTDYKSRRG